MNSPQSTPIYSRRATLATAALSAICTPLKTVAFGAMSTLALLSAAQAGPALSWDLSRDTMLNSAVSNPHAGATSGSNPNGTWSFMTSPTPMPLSSHVLLSNYEDPCAPFGVANFACWRTFTLNEPNVTMSGVTQSIHSAGVVTIHPNAAQTAIVRWTSPLAGPIQMLGRFSHINTCGDGVRYYIYKNGNQLLSGALRNLGSGSGKTFNRNLTVGVGDKLSFVVDAGANSDHYCDSTDLDLLITQQL